MVPERAERVEGERQRPVGERGGVKMHPFKPAGQRGTQRDGLRLPVDGTLNVSTYCDLIK